MFAAFRRLALISVITVIWIFIALVGVRQMGFMQEFAPFEHELLNDSFLLITDQGPETIAAYPDATAFRYLDLVHKEDSWFLSSGQALDEALSQLGDTKIVINVVEKDVYHLDSLVRTINKHISTEKVIAMSPFAKSWRRLRKIEPGWLFISSPTQLTQGQVFSSLFIETVAPFKSDIYLIPESWVKPDPSYQRLVTELKRRHKTVILRTSSPSQYKGSWLEPLVSGLLLTHSGK